MANTVTDDLRTGDRLARLAHDFAKKDRVSSTHNAVRTLGVARGDTLRAMHALCGDIQARRDHDALNLAKSARALYELSGRDDLHIDDRIVALRACISLGLRLLGAAERAHRTPAGRRAA